MEGGDSAARGNVGIIPHSRAQAIFVVFSLPQLHWNVLAAIAVGAGVALVADPRPKLNAGNES